MNRKVIILVISIIVVLFILSTTTYALFFRKDKLENSESYTAGILDIVIENDEEGLGETLNLTNSLPITDEEGKKSTPYKFKITNKGNLSYTFDLLLNNTTTSNQINSNYIKIMVDNNEPVSLSNLDNNIIASDLTLNPGDSKIISIRIWLDINTPNSEIGKVFSAKITSEGIGSEVPEAINLDISKGAITIDKGNSDNTLLVSGGGLGETVEVNNDREIQITGTSNNSISLNGVILNLVFNDLNLNINNELRTFFVGGDVNVKIVGENIISVASNLRRVSAIDVRGSLTLFGDGVLEAYGSSYAAGIGGDGDYPFVWLPETEIVGDITINSGTIIASGGDLAAGIGGGANQVNGTININGGNVTATGGAFAAGIGTGANADANGNGNCIPLTPNIINISDNAIVNANAGDSNFPNVGTSSPILGNPIGAGGASGCV